MSHKREVQSVGTHAGVEWVGAGLTANHGPLCGAFNILLCKSGGKENIQGCLGKPGAMLFIDRHPSFVRLYKKNPKQTNIKAAVEQTGVAICWSTAAELNSTLYF